MLLWLHQIWKMCYLGTLHLKEDLTCHVILSLVLSYFTTPKKQECQTKLPPPNPPRPSDLHPLCMRGNGICQPKLTSHLGQSQPFLMFGQNPSFVCSTPSTWTSQMLHLTCPLLHTLTWTPGHPWWQWSSLTELPHQHLALPHTLFAHLPPHHHQQQ